MMRTLLFLVVSVVSVVIVSASGTVLHAEDRATLEESPRSSDGWLGVSLEDHDQGVRLVGVLPNTPAAEAALLPGDRILEANGHGVQSASDLQQRVAGLRAGDTLELRVERQGEVLVRRATLEAAPSGSRSAYHRWRGHPLPWPQEASPAPWPTDRCLVVVLWASWCPACRISEELLSRWSDLGLPGEPTLVVTSDQPPEDVRGTLQRGSPLRVRDMHLLPENTFSARWFVSVLPTWFLVAPSGEVLATFAGSRDLETLRSALREAAGARCQSEPVSE